MEKAKVKLSDICKPKQWKTIPTEQLSEEGFPVYGANGVIGFYSEYNHEESVVAITCRGATCGSVTLTCPKAYITGNAMCLDEVRADVRKDYLFYCMKHYNFKNVISGSAQPQITRHGLEKVEIQIYNLDKQHDIITTLKSAEHLIGMRQSQLSALDTLIKARFVEMFGDIISNDKQWNKCVWDEVLNIKSGRSQKYVENSIGKYTICGSGGIMGYATDYITEANSVIIGRKGNINKPILMRERFWNVDTAFGLEPKNIINVDFLYIFCVLFDFEKLNKAVTIPSLTKADLLKIDIPVPPIELQNDFATFVAQVDKSKFVCYNYTRFVIKAYYAILNQGGTFNDN